MMGRSELVWALHLNSTVWYVTYTATKKVFLSFFFTFYNLVRIMIRFVLMLFRLGSQLDLVL